MLVSAIGKIRTTANRKDSLATKNTFNGDKNALKNDKSCSKKIAPQIINTKPKTSKLNYLV